MVAFETVNVVWFVVLRCEYYTKFPDFFINNSIVMYSEILACILCENISNFTSNMNFPFCFYRSLTQFSFSLLFMTALCQRSSNLSIFRRIPKMNINCRQVHAPFEQSCVFFVLIPQNEMFIRMKTDNFSHFSRIQGGIYAVR